MLYGFYAKKCMKRMHFSWTEKLVVIAENTAIQEYVAERELQSKGII